MRDFNGNWRDFKIGMPNRTLAYMLPMLGKTCWEFATNKKFLPQDNFRNIFLGDLSRECSENCLYLLYKFSGNKAYIDFEGRLQTHENYRGQYEPDRQHVMYVFEVPNERLKDYNNFKNSKYSLLSEDYKNHIRTFWNLQKHSPIIQVLYKDESIFKLLEDKVGQPISREQEAGAALIECEEYYLEEYKVKEVLVPQQEIKNHLDEE